MAEKNTRYLSGFLTNVPYMIKFSTPKWWPKPPPEAHPDWKTKYATYGTMENTVPRAKFKQKDDEGNYIEHEGVITGDDVCINVNEYVKDQLVRNGMCAGRILGIIGIQDGTSIKYTILDDSGKELPYVSKEEQQNKPTSTKKEHTTDNVASRSNSSEGPRSMAVSYAKDITVAYIMTGKEPPTLDEELERAGKYDHVFKNGFGKEPEEKPKEEAKKPVGGTGGSTSADCGKGLEQYYKDEIVVMADLIGSNQKKLRREEKQIATFSETEFVFSDWKIDVMETDILALGEEVLAKVVKGYQDLLNGKD